MLREKFSISEIHQSSLLIIRLFVVIYSIYPLIVRSNGAWGVGMWVGHIAINLVLPIMLLVYLRRHAMMVWFYTKKIIIPKLDSWPSAFVLSFVYWVALKIIYYHMMESFPGLFDVPLKAALADAPVSAGSVSPPYVVQLVIWLYASLTAGIVEELTYKLLLLLSLPRSWGIVKFTVAATILIMMFHVEQSLGDILLKAPLFAIPTALYFYKTRNLGFLISFHVFSDLFLLAPFVFS